MHENHEPREVRFWDSPVSWTVFTWIIGIILMMFGWLINSNTQLDAKTASADSELSARINSQSSEYLDIKAQLAQIQADLAWLKKNSR